MEPKDMGMFSDTGEYDGKPGLNRQGNTLSFKQAPREVFADGSPLAEGVATTLAYFEAHTYLGSDSRDAIAFANKVAGREPTKFAAWAKANFRIPATS